MSRISNKRKKKIQRRPINPDFLKLKKWALSLLGMFMLLIIPIRIACCELDIEWERADDGIDELDITAVSIIDDKQVIVFAGSERSVYRSVDLGKSWARVLMLKGENKGINHITFDPHDPRKVLIATSDGLYISKDAGRQCKRCFKGMDELQRQVTYVIVDKNIPNNILIGTKRGMFVSEDNGENWNANDRFINKRIVSIAFKNNDTYVCAEDGVYYNENGSDAWERIFVSKISEPVPDNGDTDYSESDGDESFGEINYMSSSNNRIYIATERGVFQLSDGRDWQKMSEEGLLTERVAFVLAKYGFIISSSSKGLFVYRDKKERWENITAGLPTNCVNRADISVTSRMIFAATNKGLFRGISRVSALNNFVPKEEVSDEIEAANLFKGEPSILEVQQAAIKYGEVAPEKIEWMRRSAKNKAFLPKVNVGIDGDVDRSLHVETGSTTVADFYLEGPKDKSWGYDISLSWDLGEIIWNENQTSIDVRSRLMVQLRNDILDEVTKLYFERRRLQLEILMDPPRDDKQEAQKQLRLAELTANIDALTGGYLSKRLNN